MSQEIKIIKDSGIGVMPTDTIYGLVGSAFSRRAVERIYRLRKRDRKKPFIVLISALGDLKKFGVKISKSHLKILKALWFTPSRVEGPGPTSVILPISGKRQATRFEGEARRSSDKFKYIHRGTNSIAFRLPKDKWLRVFLQKTGPLVAPSANLAGEPPAKNIAEAKKYFREKVDFYLDGGKLKGPSSVLLEFRR